MIGEGDDLQQSAHYSVFNLFTSGIHHEPKALAFIVRCCQGYFLHSESV